MEKIKMIFEKFIKKVIKKLPQICNIGVLKYSAGNRPNYRLRFLAAIFAEMTLYRM